MSAPMKTYKVIIYSRGVATIEAPTKAHAKHRARQSDFDSYELQHPECQISSLGQDKVVPTGLQPIPRPVVFRHDADTG